MSGNSRINPRFARAIEFAEQEALKKEAMKKERIAKEREDAGLVGAGMWMSQFA